MVDPGNSDDILPKIHARNEHKVSRRDIDSEALKIMYRLLRAGFKAYLVGGGVRDLLLGIKPKDFDIGTDARPNQIRSLFRNSRVIGRRFRLVHIFFRGNKIIEVATFRSLANPEEQSNIAERDKSSSSNLRINDNIYGTDQTDAFRRDLTINAMFYDLATFSIIDYVGGFEDLQNKVVRVIGDPKERFIEDPVRLFRTVRHAARTGFSIEENTKSALIANRALITQSAPMRIYEELKKDFKSGALVKVLSGLQDYQLLDYLLPELSDKNNPLLGSDSDLLRILSQVDALVARGQEVPATVILALIAIFSASRKLLAHELYGQFKDISELDDLTYESFSMLAVPKKERERISAVLTAWYDLNEIDLDRVKPNVLARKPFFQDLRTFTNLLSCNNDSALAQYLNNIDITRGDSERTYRKKGRRRPTRRPRSSSKVGEHG